MNSYKIVKAKTISKLLSNWKMISQDPGKKPGVNAVKENIVTYWGCIPRMRTDGI